LILHPLPVFLPRSEFLRHYHKQSKQTGNAERKYDLTADAVKGLEGLSNVCLPCPVAAGLVRVSAPGNIILAADIVHKG
jgi:hypothetical protein